MAVEQRLAEHLPRSEEVPAADQPLAERLQSSADVLPLEMMPVDRGGTQAGNTGGEPRKGTQVGADHPWVDSG